MSLIEEGRIALRKITNVGAPDADSATLISSALLSKLIVKA